MVDSPDDDYGPEITGTTGGDSPAPGGIGDEFGTGIGTTSAPYSTGVSPGLPLPFLLAWVDPQDNVWDYSMARVDEEIVNMELKHLEGQIPTLEIEIRNPRIGLLNPSRKQWVWLAYQPPPTAAGPAPFLVAEDFSGLPYGYGSENAPPDLTPPAVEGTPEYVAAGYVQPGYQAYDGAMVPLTPPTPATPPPLTSPSGQEPYTPYTFVPGLTIIPLFFGELLGVPTDLFAQKITLKFVARAMNYIELKQAIAETLKIPGNYEPIFLDEKKRDDPDAILEGWSKLYHVDRTTLAVSASDVLVGEDGTVVFQEFPAVQSAIYKSLRVKIGQAPLTNVQVQAKVHWTQRTIGYVAGPNVNVASYTGSTFAADFPKPGKTLGAGWTVESSYVNDPFLVAHTPSWHITTHETFYGGTGIGGAPTGGYDCSVVSVDESQSGPALLGPSLNAQIVTTDISGVCYPGAFPSTGADIEPASNIPARMELKRLYIPLWSLNCSWTLRYNAKREFSETAIVIVNANAQAILTSPTVEQDTTLIKMDGEVGQPIIIYDAWSDYANSIVGPGILIFPNDPVSAGGLSYQVSVNTTPGYTGNDEPVFSDVPGTITMDNQVQWASLGENPQNAIQKMTFATSYDVGTILVYVEQVFDPDVGALVDTINSTYYLVTEPCSTTSVYTEYTYTPPLTESDQILFPPATRRIFVEQFSPVPGMISLGSSPAFLGIPVGGTAENVTARCFFPTARGQQALVYGINRARAKIRMRARAVEVSWDCGFDMVVGMSCRQNATVYDSRLPGGVATGKIIAYSMTAKNGKLRGHVTIGCSVGYNSFGNPGADISYTPPIFEPFDDNLNFPLASLPCDGGIFTMSLSDQTRALQPGIQAYLTAIAIQNPAPPANVSQGGAGGVTTTTTGIGPIAAWTAGIDAAVLPELMQSNPIGWSCEINPVTNGPFSGAYAVFVSLLELPMGIDLTADSENE